MNQQEPHFLEIGQGVHARRIAYRFDGGASDTSPAIVWLSGFLSDMASTKVVFLSEWASEKGYAILRFDYSGHGLSGGDIQKASVGAWLEEAVAMLELVSKRPIILVGSSLGGWISLLLARTLGQHGDAGLKGLVLIAPAWDMTEKLMWEKMSDDARNAVLTEGVFYAPSDYDDPYPITRILIEEGRKHLLASRNIPVSAPVRILQGMHDEDVPWEHSVALVDLLAEDDVDLTLVKTGGHRLSEPGDLRRLARTIEALIKPDATLA
ncbi:MAG: alpha/beta fold hydrolase [Methyloceanibacter sp.]